MQKKVAVDKNTAKQNNVPHKKMSKKRKQELNKEKRKTWEFSPVMRIKESKKTYNRKEFKQYEEV